MCRDLEIRSVMLDEMMKQPIEQQTQVGVGGESSLSLSVSLCLSLCLSLPLCSSSPRALMPAQPPSRDLVIDFETKSFREVREKVCPLLILLCPLCSLPCVTCDDPFCSATQLWIM